MHNEEDNRLAYINQLLESLSIRVRSHGMDEDRIPKITDQTSQQILLKIIHQVHEHYLKQLAKQIVNPKMLDLLFDLAHYVDQRYPGSQEVKKFISSHLQKISAISMQQSDDDRSSNTPDHKKIMSRLFLELYQIFTPRSHDVLPARLKSLNDRLVQHDVTAYTELFELLYEYENQLQSTHHHNPKETAHAVSYLHYMREFILQTVISQNDLYPNNLKMRVLTIRLQEVETF